MTVDEKALRVEGIYQQKDADQYMLRVKLASGLLSVAQAKTLARLGQQYGSGTLHLTTRGSLEFHDLRFEQLPLLQRGMAAVGLFSRGACGGAVRGISCSSGFGRGFNHSQVLARKLLHYFSGNPHFEGLPKKFKIAVEADYSGSHHLIQDLALVFAGEEQGTANYDVWIGGGLGRAPQSAFLYRKLVPEIELLPLIEAVIRVYCANVAPQKRLKTLIAALGEEAFRQILAEELASASQVAFNDAYPKNLLPVNEVQNDLKMIIPVFAGELPASTLSKLVTLAEDAGLAYLLVTTDQDLALLPNSRHEREQLLGALAVSFKDLDLPASVLRVCPGSHECRMGLCATRDLARSLQKRFGAGLYKKTVAISGCPNSCAQPQLAEIGIIASKSMKNDDGSRSPRFDLYRRFDDAGLGDRVAEKLTKEALLDLLAAEF